MPAQKQSSAQQQQHHHRPTLKQTNKPFKSKHSTKGALKDANKGRVERSNPKSSNHPTSQSTKQARRNTAKQIQANKRASLFESTRIFSSSGTSWGKAPRVVSVVELCPDVDGKKVVKKLLEAVDAQVADGEEGNNVWNVEISRFKSTKVQFLFPPSPVALSPAKSPISPTSSVFSTIDACSSSDFTIFVLSPDAEVPPSGEVLLRSLQAHGLGGGSGAEGGASGSSNASLTGSGRGGKDSVLGVVAGLEGEGRKEKEKEGVRKSLLSYLNYFFPGIEKIFSVDVALEKVGIDEGVGEEEEMEIEKEDGVKKGGGKAETETINLVRSLCERVPGRESKWKEGRGRIVAEGVEWEESGETGGDGEEEAKGEGILRITGVVRGGRISSNRLVHLPGWGDFKIQQITSSPLTSRPQRPTQSSTMEAEPTTTNVLSVPDPDEADSLQSTNVPSEGADLGEQTWPTEDEIAEGQKRQDLLMSGEDGVMLPEAKKGTTPKRLKRVPKGTSTYQAVWLVDEDEEGDEEGDDYDDSDDDEEMGGDGMVEDDEDGEVRRGKGGLVEEDDDEEYENIDPNADDQTSVQGTLIGTATGTATGVTFQDLPEEIEAAQYSDYLSKRKSDQEQRDDAEFPDEVDTPQDVSARQRFARYRGLKSFRTSEWDPYEELPADYARLFMIRDWKRMGKKLKMRAGEDGVEVGSRVTLHIEGVPQEVIAEHQRTKAPFVAFSLFQHEHKYSVMNFSVHRNTEFTDSVRSKDSLVLQLGPRRFSINPLFSQHTHANNGKGTNNVHKFQRYLRPVSETSASSNISVGTSYLPLTFGTNVPALLFRPPLAGEVEKQGELGLGLISTGGLLSSDPTRIVAKRIILTGHPYKVHRRTATIRYMFFNRPDVEYFKPVELVTKMGRRGHIREPLGTHGYFKAGFDGSLSQMDTVELRLYKRCFPKWGKIWRVDGNLEGEEGGDGDADQEMAVE